MALSLSFRRTGGGKDWRWSLVLGAAVLAIVYPALLLTNSRLADFLTTPELVTASGYLTLLIVAVIESRFRLLAVVLVLPHIVVFGLVNPVDRGLGVVKPLRSFGLFAPGRGPATRWIVLFAVPAGFDVLCSGWVRSGERPEIRARPEDAQRARPDGRTTRPVESQCLAVGGAGIW